MIILLSLSIIPCVRTFLQYLPRHYRRSVKCYAPNHYLYHCVMFYNERSALCRMTLQCKYL